MTIEVKQISETLHIHLRLIARLPRPNGGKGGFAKDNELAKKASKLGVEARKRKLCP